MDPSGPITSILERKRKIDESGLGMLFLRAASNNEPITGRRIEERTPKPISKFRNFCNKIYKINSGCKI